MVVLLVIFAILAALTAGFVGLITVGTGVAIVLLVLIAAAAVVVIVWWSRFMAIAAAAFVVVTLAAVGYGGYTVYVVVRALTDDSGSVDLPDAAALASANAKLDAADGKAGFRIEMTADEIEAVMMDALQGADKNPIRRVDLEVLDGKDGGQGSLHFKAEFKSGSQSASGKVNSRIEAGAIKVNVLDVKVASLKVPGLARGLVEDIVETATDLTDRLEEHGADVQSVEIGNGLIVITGTTANGEFVSLGTVLDGVRDNIASLSNATTPRPETLGPGTVDALEAAGDSYYVALGDSLAANVGVSSPSLAYVARFHKHLQGRASGTLGLRNFGVSGETSGSLIRMGQLKAAIDFMEDNEVAYVTIDIGANDLLGHLYSPDCSETLENAACQARVDSTLLAYADNLDDILKRIRSAAPDAKIVFLGAYNPFSLGFGASVSLEGQSDAALQRLNDVAATAASKHKVTYADGFTPMKGTAATTTHMLETPPDIHPTAIGEDVLAGALVAALR